MDSSVAARRILITGGTSGIGEACAARLAGSRDQVWVLSSDPDKVAAAAQRYPELAGASVCDVTDEGQVISAVREASGALGGLDGVFVNAGIDGQGVAAAELELSFFRRVLEVNVLGAFAVAKAVLPVLSRPGTILFNASANALRPEAHFADYNASKAAVASVARTMALELSGQGVSVMALCPGYFPSAMTAGSMADPVIREELLSRIPARRFGDLSEIAELVSFLLSPAAAFMTGSLITIDGATTV